MYTRLSVRRTLLPLAVAVASPLALHAQETQLFTWNGRVDREVQITVRGNQLTNSTEPSMQTRGRFRENSALPSRDGTIRVVTETGRGEVAVIQQPASDNGYAAVIRLRDNDGGADTYRVTAYFTPADAGRNGRGMYGRRDDRRDDRRTDRRDDRYGRNQSSGPSLHWTGDVDGTIDIMWREGGASARVVNGAAIRGMTSSVSGGTTYQGVGISVTAGKAAAASRWYSSRARRIATRPSFASPTLPPGSATMTSRRHGSRAMKV